VIRTWQTCKPLRCEPRKCQYMNITKLGFRYYFVKCKITKGESTFFNFRSNAISKLANHWSWPRVSAINWTSCEVICTSHNNAVSIFIPPLVHRTDVNALKGNTDFKPSVLCSSWNLNISGHWRAKDFQNHFHTH